MRKFTIFTVLLTIVIVLVVGQILVDEYLPGLNEKVSGELSVILPDSLSFSEDGRNVFFGSDLAETGEITFENEDKSEIEKSEGNEKIEESDPWQFMDRTTDSQKSLSDVSGPADFEDFNYTSSPSGTAGQVYLREEQIKSAGFVGAYIEQEEDDGMLFKSVVVDDLDDVQMDKFAIRTEDQFLAKVYVFRAGVIANIRDVYQLLKSKAAQGIDVQVNETNQFGMNSFYMNDSRRSGVAFLTVRIGSLIYSFSYPHEYHSQIKNLIQLLEWEWQ